MPTSDSQPGTRKRYGPWRIRLEYVLARVALCVVPYFPRCVICGLAFVAGWSAPWISRREWRLGQANLGLVYGSTLSTQETRRLLRRTFRNFALTGMDLFWFQRFRARRIARYFRWDVSFEPLFTQSAHLCLTGHFGNWELLGTALADKGTGLMSVATPLRNPLVDRHLNAFREQTGQTIIPRQGAIRKLLRGLQQHRKMGVLLDQNTHPDEGGVFVPFMGLPVAVSSSPAAIALKVGAPVTVTLCRHDDHGGYIAYAPESIPLPDPNEFVDPVLELTDRMTAAMERAIRAHPDNWLWMYKRWRYIPADWPEPGKFPFYARVLTDFNASRPVSAVRPGDAP